MMHRARTPAAKRERRQRILAAALDEFYERGFAAARADDIAARAGLSKGTLYLYFANKEDIFRELIADIAGPRLKAIEELMTGVPSFAAAMEGFAVFAPAMIRDSEMPRLLKILIGDARNFPEVVQAYRQETIERVLNAVAGMLARCSERGDITATEPALTARLLVAPVVMSGIWEAVFADAAEPVDLDALFRLHAQYLQRALAPLETA